MNRLLNIIFIILGVIWLSVLFFLPPLDLREYCLTFYLHFTTQPDSFFGLLLSPFTAMLASGMATFVSVIFAVKGKRNLLPVLILNAYFLLTVALHYPEITRIYSEVIDLGIFRLYNISLTIIALFILTAAFLIVFVIDYLQNKDLQETEKEEVINPVKTDAPVTKAVSKKVTEDEIVENSELPTNEPVADKDAFVAYDEPEKNEVIIPEYKKPAKALNAEIPKLGRGVIRKQRIESKLKNSEQESKDKILL